MNNFSFRLILLSLAFLLGGCGGHQPDDAASAISPVNSVKAILFTVQTSELPVVASYPASVVSEQQIQIASRIMGYVRHINVEVGQQVKQGDLLITVDPSDIQGQVSMSGASLAQAEAALADAKSDYERFGDLYREEAIPKAQWDKIRLQYSIAQQQANAARAGHASANAQMRYAEIRAPFSGIITQRAASVGALAAPGQTLLSLVNPAQLNVEAQVSETTFSQLSLNEPVTLHVNQMTLTGTITHLVSAADPVTHTHLVKIGLPHDVALQSGMFAQVDFPMGKRQGLRIPGSAVIARAGISGVFVVDQNHIAHYRMVRVGGTALGQTEIQAGLTAGEQVVDNPDASLQSGDKIVAGDGNV